MSRIGRNPVAIPAGVTVSFSEGLLKVKGPLGQLEQKIEESKIGVTVTAKEATVTRASEVKTVKAMHGLYRALLANMVTGVTTGFTKFLVVQGVGYKVQKQGNKVVFNVGYSHPVEFEIPQGITIDCPSITEVTVKGISKEIVGQAAANIKDIKRPDPYHAYGIRYKDEVIHRKEGKTAGK